MTKTITHRSRIAHNGSKGHHSVGDLKSLVSEARSTVANTASHATVDLPALRDRLKDIQHGPDSRVILVVKSVGLLARYSVGLTVFYDWIIGSFAAVILLLEDTKERIEWPEEVRCESDRLLRYFSEPGMVKEVFSTNG